MGKKPTSIDPARRVADQVSGIISEVSSGGALQRVEAAVRAVSGTPSDCACGGCAQDLRDDPHFMASLDRPLDPGDENIMSIGAVLRFARMSADEQRAVLPRIVERYAILWRSC